MRLPLPEGHAAPGMRPSAEAGAVGGKETHSGASAGLPEQSDGAPGAARPFGEAASS